MKNMVFAALLLLAPVAARANETAYTALRVLGKRDPAALNSVVEVRGRTGAPQPDLWKVVVEDRQARGGVREFEIQKGRIVAERTPMSRGLGSRMNFNQLNLDSDGVFTVVNQEAQKQRATFDHLDYLLKAGTGGGAPIWEVQLYEGSAPAGRMAIAADSGSVLDASLARTNGGPRIPRDDEPIDRRPPPDEERGGQKRWSEPGESFQGPDDFFHRLGKRFERRGNQLKNFFTDKPRSRDRE